MEYVKLGQSDIEVSKYCFGSLTLGPLAANLSVEQGKNLLLEAFHAGVTFIDTAQYYQNYPQIKAALSAYTDGDHIVVATKTYAQTDLEAAYAVEEARLELNRDQIDIFLMHEIRDIDDFRSREEAWRVLKEAKANGAIRLIGISTHSAAVAEWAADDPDIDIMQCMINKVGIGIIDGNREDMLSAINKAVQNGKAVYGMKAIGGGALMNTAKESLLWAFSESGTDAFAVGCKDSCELKTNIGWIEGREVPEAAHVKKLDRNIVFDKDPYCHGCGLCVAKCASGAMTLGEDGTAQWDKSKCVYCGYCIGACPWFCISFC